jgi:hypothetical protein
MAKIGAIADSQIIFARIFAKNNKKWPKICCFQAIFNKNEVIILLRALRIRRFWY